MRGPETCRRGSVGGKESRDVSRKKHLVVLSGPEDRTSHRDFQVPVSVHLRPTVLSPTRPSLPDLPFVKGSRPTTVPS